NTKYPTQLINIKGPAGADELLEWTALVLAQTDIAPQVAIVEPNKNVFQLHKKKSERDIYFFVNSNKREAVTLPVTFKHKDKTPWIWNPEDGSRKKATFRKEHGTAFLELNPLESMLLVFEPGGINDSTAVVGTPLQKATSFEGP